MCLSWSGRRVGWMSGITMVTHEMASHSFLDTWDIYVVVSMPQALARTPVPTYTPFVSGHVGICITKIVLGIHTHTQSLIMSTLSYRPIQLSRPALYLTCFLLPLVSRLVHDCTPNASSGTSNFTAQDDELAGWTARLTRQVSGD
jgi:hypothetical protein